MYFTNKKIVSRAKRMNNKVVRMFIQDYIYLDLSQNAKLIQAVNNAKQVSIPNMDDELSISKFAEDDQA